MSRLILLLLSLPLLAGCLAALEPAPAIDVVSRSFSESMRWKDFSAAAKYVHSDSRDAFLAQFTVDDDLHVVDSRIDYLNIEQEDAVTVTYKLEYYRLPSGSIKKWGWEQQWQLLEEKGKADMWLIMNEPPALPWKR